MASIAMFEKGYAVVWDLETRNLIQDAVGRRREDKVKALDVSCLCAMKLDSQLIMDGSEEALSNALEAAEWVVVWAHAPPGPWKTPFEQLFKLFDDAEVIGSYNGLGFDHLVIQKYYEGVGGLERHLRHAFKSVDLFQRVRDTHGKWFKLDAMLAANNLETKPASGLDAVRWWSEGKLGDIEAYCKSDVCQLAKLMLLPRLAIPETNNIYAPASLFALGPAIAAARFQHMATGGKRSRVDNGESGDCLPSEAREAAEHRDD